MTLSDTGLEIANKTMCKRTYRKIKDTESRPLIPMLLMILYMDLQPLSGKNSAQHVVCSTKFAAIREGMVSFKVKEYDYREVSQWVFGAMSGTRMIPRSQYNDR